MTKKATMAEISSLKKQIKGLKAEAKPLDKEADTMKIANLGARITAMESIMVFLEGKLNGTNRTGFGDKRTPS